MCGPATVRPTSMTVCQPIPDGSTSKMSCMLGLSGRVMSIMLFSLVVVVMKWFGPLVDRCRDSADLLVDAATRALSHTNTASHDRERRGGRGVAVTVDAPFTCPNE